MAERQKWSKAVLLQLAVDLEYQTLEEIADERDTDVNTLRVTINNHTSERRSTLEAGEKAILKEA